MALSEFQQVFHGFEHAGLRLEVDPERSGQAHVAFCWIVDTQTGERVGEFLRWLYRRDGRLCLRAENVQLDERYRGRGFTWAANVGLSPRYRELGVEALTMTAREKAAVLWTRFGFDFDLEGVEGPDEARQRARSVAEIFSPDAPRRTTRRRLPPWPKRGPNPHDVLKAREKEGGASAAAVCALRARIPTQEQIGSGELDGTFRTPAEIADFEVHGVRIGREAMSCSMWRGIRYEQPR